MIQDEEHNPLVDKLLASYDSPKSSREDSTNIPGFRGSLTDRKSIGGTTDRKSLSGSRSKFSSIDGARSR